MTTGDASATTPIHEHVLDNGLKVLIKEVHTAEFFELGLDHDRRFPDLVEGVKREDVHEASRASLVPSAAAVVIAGPYEDRG